MISRDEALKIVLEETSLGGTEERYILDCLDKALYEDIYAKDNLPPFHKSAMDGYAIKSENTIGASEENPIVFKVIGTIKAGQFSEEELKSGEAFRIMTGAPVPKGADAVIQFEKVKNEDNRLFIYEEVKSFKNIIKSGEEIKAGEIALTKGTVIRPFEIGLLASLGYSKVLVYRTPVISLITTGDELLSIDSELKPGKIRNSNEYSIRALIKNIGARALSFGVLEDSKELLMERVKQALEQSDIVLTSGGASKGDYDFVEDALKELEADIKFTSVGIKPGKPLSFAKVKNKLFFSLPGNPLAAITTFQEFVKPACEKIMGKTTRTNIFPVILADDYISKKGRRKYIYVNIQKVNGIYYAYKIDSQSSSGLKAVIKSNGIVILPEEKGSVKSGEILNGYYIFK